MSIIYGYLQKIRQQEYQQSSPLLQGRHHVDKMQSSRVLRLSLIGAVFLIFSASLVLGLKIIMGGVTPFQPDQSFSTPEKISLEQKLKRQLDSNRKIEVSNSGKKANFTSSTNKNETTKSKASHIAALKEEVRGMVNSKGNVLTPSDPLKSGTQQQDEHKDSLSAETSEPDLKLEQHFSAQVSKNIKVLELQKELRLLVSKGDLDKAGQKLSDLKAVLGQDSLLYMKWTGVLALKQEDYRQAEIMFRRVLSRTSEDKQCRVNLVLALMGQKKVGSAREIVQKMLAEKYPEDETFQHLGQALGMEEVG